MLRSILAEPGQRLVWRFAAHWNDDRAILDGRRQSTDRRYCNGDEGREPANSFDLVNRLCALDKRGVAAVTAVEDSRQFLPSIEKGIGLIDQCVGRSNLRPGIAWRALCCWPLAVA